MAKRPPDPADPTAGAVSGDVLAGYLRAQATRFLRALRLHRDTGGDGATQARTRTRDAVDGPPECVDASRALHRSARRISACLHTYRPLLDTDWSLTVGSELAWLSRVLATEHGYATRLERMLHALHRLSGTTGQAGVPGQAGAAKAGALLERQLTLARNRAHSSALRALGSSRFHALADHVAVLASEVPLTPAAATADLRPLAASAAVRLTDAVRALPLMTAGLPYNAAALVHVLSPEPDSQPQDAPWHHVRLLLRLHRYAHEVLLGDETGTDVPQDVRLLAAGAALDRHHDASEAASAVARAARTPRIAPATAYALGVLHAGQRHEVEAARFTFRHAWQPSPQPADPAHHA